MADDAQFDAFSGLMTPQSLAQARAAQLQGQLNQAGQLSGIDYAARSGGLMLGAGLAQASNGAPSLDDVAAQNQQMMMDPTGAPQTGDSYEDNAANYEALAKRFLSAGNASQASRFIQAAQIMRSEGANYKTNQLKQQLTQGQIADQRANDQYVVVDSSPDKNGIPQYKKIGDEFSLFDDSGNPDPQAFKQSRQDAIQKAREAGIQNPTVMKVSDLENSKAYTAAIRATGQQGVAQTRAQSAMDVAGIRASAAAKKQADMLGLLTPDAQEEAYQYSLSHDGKTPQSYGRNPAMQAQLANYIASRMKEEGNTAGFALANTQAWKTSGLVQADFAKGQTSKSIDAINTAVGHMYQTLPLVDQLASGDARVVRAAQIGIAKAIGYKGQSDNINYEMLSTMFAEEMAKSVLPGGGAEKERDAIAAPFKSVNSAATLKSAIVQGAEAMSSKTNALRQRWDAATSGRYGSFDQWLAPATQKALGIESPGAAGISQQTPAAPSNAQPSGAAAPGKVLNYNPTTGKFE